MHMGVSHPAQLEMRITSSTERSRQMKWTMGKLLFVNTNRTNGIAGMVICACMIILGLWTALSGAYAGILFVPLGILGGKFCLKIATLKTQVYEQGFVSTHIFGRTSGRYGELKSISRGATRTNGVLMTNIHFVTRSGAKATVTNEGLGKDDKMGQLLNYSCHALASNWMTSLERQNEVVWMMKDSLPIMKIRKDGVLIKEKTGVESFIPLNQFHANPGYALAVDICYGDKKALKVNTGEPNYFVGEMLIAMLVNNQQRPLPAKSVELVAQ
jgi:hypothetical protein